MVDESLRIALAVLLIVLGIVGLLLPLLPGIPLLLAGIVVAAWAEDFRVGWRWLVPIFALGCLAYAIDFAAGAFGAKRFGATRQGILGAFAGALLGLFFGLPGVLLGPFLGALAGELLARGDLRAAGRAGPCARPGAPASARPSASRSARPPSSRWPPSCSGSSCSRASRVGREPQHHAWGSTPEASSHAAMRSAARACPAGFQCVSFR